MNTLVDAINSVELKVDQQTVPNLVKERKRTTTLPSKQSSTAILLPAYTSAVADTPARADIESVNDSVNDQVIDHNKLNTILEAEQTTQPHFSKAIVPTLDIHTAHKQKIQLSLKELSQENH